ncbi:hypothetical protein EDC04DRAFT_2600667 [Pisolithus marmoratus]|nr:hypothetical protein EDC04DRAFT_2600667 [Pisolithus marmoratus]
MPGKRHPCGHPVYIATNAKAEIAKTPAIIMGQTQGSKNGILMMQGNGALRIFDSDDYCTLQYSSLSSEAIGARSRSGGSTAQALRGGLLKRVLDWRQQPGSLRVPNVIIHLPVLSTPQLPIGTKDAIAERVTVGGLGTCEGDFTGTDEQKHKGSCPGNRKADTDCDVDEGNDRRDHIGTLEIHALSWYMIEVGGGDTYLLCLPFSPQV